MLELSQLQLDKEEKHLFSDVSFILAKKGFTSILTYCEESDILLAQYLSGIKKIEQGRLLYSGEEVSLDFYRKHICLALFEDLLVFEDQSVVDNITLLYEVEEAKLRKILFDLKLLDVKNRKVQVLPFEMRVRVLIARILYFEYPITLFYPDSSKYAMKERKMIYEQFSLYYPYQFIVIADQSANQYATRVIEMDQGYMMSDSCVIKEVKKETINQRKGLSKQAFDLYKQQLNQQYRSFYRLLFILIIVIMVVSSILVNAATLNVKNIQVRMMEEQKLVELKKSNVNDYITLAEMNAIQNQLKGNLICNYNAIDQKYSLAYLQGYYGKDNEVYPISSEYHICEYLDVSMLNHVVEGHFPKNNNEVLLSIDTVEAIIGTQNKVEDAIGKQFYWYGDQLTIVGILENKEEFKQRLFVLEGYMQQHLLSNMKVFPQSEKEIVISDEIIAMDDIQKEERLYYFVDEEGMKYHDSLEKQEIVLGFEVAQKLGFQYQQEIKNYMDYLLLIQQYQSFIQPYLNQNISLNAYRNKEDKLHTKIIQDDFKILGFVPPSYEEAQTNKSYYGKVAYLADSYLDKYFVTNIKINDVYYQSNNKDIKEYDLGVLEHLKQYKLVFEKSPILDLLVIDFKELTSFLGISLFTFAILTYMVYYMLMKKTLRNKRKQASLYYRLGETKNTLIQIYEKHYLKKISRYIKVATVIGLSIQFIYLLLVVLILNGVLYYFILMLLPIFIALLFYIGFILIGKILLNDSMIFIEAYGGSGDE